MLNGGLAEDHMNLQMNQPPQNRQNYAYTKLVLQIGSIHLIWCMKIIMFMNIECLFLSDTIPIICNDALTKRNLKIIIL